MLLQEARPPSKVYLKRLYRICIKSQIDVFLANTHSAQEYLQSVGIPQEKIVCRPYLVPPEPVALSITPLITPRRTDSARPIFLFVWQLIPGKGVLNLLEVASLLKRQGKIFSVWILGDGPQRKEIDKKIEDLNLSQVVWLFGRVPYEQVGIFYNACDVFVLSTLQDYRSVAVMEAASLRLLA